MTTAQQPTLAAQASPPQSRHLVGYAALVGLALFLASFATFAPESAPDPGTASAADVRRFATDNAGTTQLNTLAALASIALLLTFVAVLAHQMRQVRPGSIGPSILLCLAGVVAVPILFLTAVSSIFARPDQLSEVSDQALVTIYQMTAVAEWLYTLTILVPCMAIVGIYSWSSLRYRLIARWVSWAGFAVAASGPLTAIVLVVPSVQFDPFLLPLFGWWLWPGIVGSASAVRWWRSR